MEANRNNKLTRIEKTWIIIGLAFGVSVIYHLFSDEELNPEITRLHNEFLKNHEAIKTNSDNAYLKLAAIGYGDETPYNNAKIDYLNSLVNKPPNLFVYPRNPNYEKLMTNLKPCNLSKKGCIKSLIDNSQKMRKLVFKVKPFFNKIYSIGLESDFTPLNSQHSQVDLNFLQLVIDTSAIDIFYLIQDKRLQQAADKIIFQIQLLKKLSRFDNSMLFRATLLANHNRVFHPLLNQLLVNGFKQWDPVLKALEPVNYSYSSIDSLHWMLIENIEQMDLIASLKKKNPSLLAWLRMKLLYKKNITINQNFNMMSSISVAKNIPKYKLLEAIKIANRNNNILQKNSMEMANNTILFFYKNYKNMAGAIMLEGVVPIYFSMEKEFIDLELRNKLLALRIYIYQKSIQPYDYPSLISKQKFINPYSLKPPFLKGGQACYKVPKEICIDLAVK